MFYASNYIEHQFIGSWIKHPNHMRRPFLLAQHIRLERVKDLVKKMYIYTNKKKILMKCTFWTNSKPKMTNPTIKTNSHDDHIAYTSTHKNLSYSSSNKIDPVSKKKHLRAHWVSMNLLHITCLLVLRRLHPKSSLLALHSVNKTTNDYHPNNRLNESLSVHLAIRVTL